MTFATALLVYLLLRFWACLSQWGHSFTRLFALVRSALWQKLACSSLLECYGTADSHTIAKTTKSLNPFCRRDAAPEQVEKLLVLCQVQFPQMLGFYCSTIFAGLRPSEAQRVQWGHMSFDPNQVVVKAGRPRKNFSVNWLSI